MDGDAMAESAVTCVNPAGVSRPGGHYSHAVIANGMVYVSGQLPVTAAGEKLVGAGFDAQARQVLANVKAILEGCGSGIEHLVQVRVYVDGIENWPAFNAVYAAWAGEAKPARAVVPVPGLHYGFKVEVEAVAVVPQSLGPGSRPG
jgi:2-iminobutanoate/2-iminopropanoate deaminase